MGGKVFTWGAVRKKLPPQVKKNLGTPLVRAALSNNRVSLLGNRDKSSCFLVSWRFEVENENDFVNIIICPRVQYRRKRNRSFNSIVPLIKVFYTNCFKCIVYYTYTIWSLKRFTFSLSCTYGKNRYTLYKYADTSCLILFFFNLFKKVNYKNVAIRVPIQKTGSNISIINGDVIPT